MVKQNQNSPPEPNDQEPIEGLTPFKDALRRVVDELIEKAEAYGSSTDSVEPVGSQKPVIGDNSAGTEEFEDIPKADVHSSDEELSPEIRFEQSGIKATQRARRIFLEREHALSKLNELQKEHRRRHPVVSGHEDYEEDPELDEEIQKTALELQDLDAQVLNLPRRKL